MRIYAAIVVLGSAGILAACSLTHRGDELRAKAASSEKLTDERNFYREQAAAFSAMVMRERKDTEAAYAKGLRDGHAQVNCTPSWPTVTTRRRADGSFESVQVPVKKPLPPVKAVPPVAAHKKPEAYCKPHKGTGARQSWECP